MRLLLDEHLSPVVAEQLRSRGHDVVSAVEAGLQQQTDYALMAWAAREVRTIVTPNYADFRQLHELYLSRGEPHPGLIFIPRRFSLASAGFGRLIEALDALLKTDSPQRTLQSWELWLQRPEQA